MGFPFGKLEPARLLDRLVAEGLIDAAGARRAIEASERAGTGVERTLLEFGLVPEEALYRALAEHLDLPFATAEDIEPGLARSLGLAPEFLLRVEAVPAREEAEVLWIALADPRGADTVKSIGFHLARPVRAALAAPATVKAALAALGGAERGAQAAGTSESDIERLRAMANDGPVIKLVNDLIADAAAQGASDIHIEAEEHGARVRFRVDGALKVERAIAEAHRAAVVSRLKVMANLNISEKRRPQDGRVGASVRGRRIDIRLSTLPTQHGESIVLRLLDQSRIELDWRALGFPPDSVAEIEAILAQPNGIFLVAGPTGSGKTTTLYTALSRIRSEARKIVTVEDPIEYALKGVAQVQVEPAIEMTFARALRAILRQDPDVIMVGEIRDEETAEIAVRAALVGRLVLSTIHTNDSLAAVDRLIDLGVPRYLLGATLRGVLSQRLVRRLCGGCGGRGCGACGQSGRRGRIVVSELLRVTTDVADAIAGRVGAPELSDAARGAGFCDLWAAGKALITSGLVAEGDLIGALGAASRE